MNVFEDILNQKKPEKEEDKSEKTIEKVTEKNTEKNTEKKAESKKTTPPATNLFDPNTFDPDAKDPESGILLRHLDPRPDIKADHLDWMDILQNCLVWDGFTEGHGEHLWGVLHGLRCGGAQIRRIKSSGSGGGLGYKLLPGDEDWKQEAEWQRIRKEHLDGVKEDLVELFKFTKEHGRLARMEEIWPEGNGAEDKNNNVPKGSQTKLF